MSVIDALRARVPDVTGPGDAGYDDLRAVFSSRVDRRPLAVASCRSAAEVAGAVETARDLGVPFGVRGGGMSDLGTLDDGVLLDVSPMDAVEVDDVAGIAVAGGGATWAGFDTATQRHGLAVTGGRLSRLGVAGVAIGEGSGWLERSFGPTGRSITRAEVVLDDGRIVDTDEGHPDLLQALRSGEPGSGVVTRLWLDLHPVGPLLTCGFLTFPRTRAAAVGRALRDLLARSPAATSGALTLNAGRAGACTVTFLHVGDLEAGERAVAPLRSMEPSLDAVKPNEYRALQAMGDLQHPWGMRAHRRTGRLDGLSDAAIDAAVEATQAPAATLSRLTLRPLGMPGEARPAWGLECLGLWPPVPGLDDGNLAWVEGVADAMAPFTSAA